MNIHKKFCFYGFTLTFSRSLRFRLFISSIFYSSSMILFCLLIKNPIFICHNYIWFCSRMSTPGTIICERFVRAF